MSMEEEAENLKRNIEKMMAEKLKIALFGQPGSGKSSLINELVGKRMAKTGPETDTTVAVEAFEVKREVCFGDFEELTVHDLPGFGTKAFPKKGYFERFDILKKDLLLCVFSGALHELDHDFFRELRREGKTCIFVRNKSDEIWEKDEEGKDVPTEKLQAVIVDDIEKQVGRREKVIFTSCKTQEGLEELWGEIYSRLDDANKEKWARNAVAHTREHLKKKKAACDGIIQAHSWMAAANGLNPIPGTDIAIDIGIILQLFKEIKDCYGLTDERLAKEELVQQIGPIVNNILKTATKKGVSLLLKKIAPTVAGKSILRKIPILNILIAAPLGYIITSQAGYSFRDDCHEVAKAILEDELKGK